MERLAIAYQNMGDFIRILPIMRRGLVRLASWGPMALAADQRGVTTLVFAVSASVLLGFVGLGTEVGTWYLARSQASNVADAAAIAGALAANAVLTANPNASQGQLQTAAQRAVSDVISYNYPTYTDQCTLQGPTPTTSKTVVIAASCNSPPLSGNYTLNQTSLSLPNPAVEVLVGLYRQPLLARLFSSLSISITARAVGLVQPSQASLSYPVCALSLSGPLTIQLPQNSPCYYTSNDSNANAVIIQNDASIGIFAMSAVGDCPTCPFVPPLTGPTPGPADVPQRPFAAYQPPTFNPYSALDTPDLLRTDASRITCIPPLNQAPGTCPSTTTPMTIPAGGSLVPSTGDGSTCTPTATTSPCAYYNVDVTINSDTNLMPGTYFFVNSSLTISGGTVQCYGTIHNVLGPCDNTEGFGSANPVNGTYGVAFVMTGNPAGKLIVGAGATVLLNAQANHAGANPNAGLDGYTALNGILFYRASAAGTETAAVPVDIIDTTNASVLNGGMYFPNAAVYFAANVANSGALNCSILVADTLTLGFSPTDSIPSTPPTMYFVPGSCPVPTGGYNSPVPYVTSAQLVE